MRITLIGMSGCGKTYWSKAFARQGFKLLCCDDLISEKLRSVLTRPDGSVLDLGHWMGFPYESRYENRERKYLELETAVLQEILTDLKNSHH